MSFGQRWVLHPVLVSATFVLDVALANDVEPAAFIRPLLISVLAAGLLTLLASAIARDRWLGGLAATAVIGAILSLRPFVLFWTWLREWVGPGIAATVLAFVVFGILAIPAILGLRARAGHGLVRMPATNFLNTASLLLLIVTVLAYAGPDLPAMVARAIDREPIVTVKLPAQGPPDIYVILMDGYPRADVLERRFGFDNSEFLSKLTERAFTVGTDNHSNYVFTQLTLASMFQMRHLKDVESLAPLIGTPGAHPGALQAAISDGQVFDALQAAGYDVVATSSGYGHVSLRGVADRFIDHGEMTDFERSVLNRTWLVEALGAVDPTAYSGPQRDRLDHAFTDIATLALERRDRPLFAYIHVPAPHLPLIVNAAGKALPVSPRNFDALDAAAFGMTETEFADAYSAEISYLNQRVLAAVQALQTDSPREPVIIVMSDHGYTHDVDRIDVQARFGNLFAASTPGAPDLFEQPPTPVNLFSILLNHYLGTDFPVAQDRYFLALSPFELLQLREIKDPEAALP